MTVITRNDQTRLVLDTYRQCVKVQKKSQLARFLRDQAGLHGDFAAYQELSPTDVIITLATDAGYLLAENIRHYFHANPNLIFCEWSTQLDALVVIVINAGRVVLDRSLAPTTLTEALESLHVSAMEFQLVVAGEGVNSTAPPTWAYPLISRCSSHEFLPASVLAHLPVHAETTLQPLIPLSKTLAWHSHHPLLLGLAASVTLVMGIGVFSYREYWLKRPEAAASTPTVISPSQPAATEVLQLTATLMQQLRTLPGWRVRSLQVEPPQLVVHLQQAEGSVSTLTELVQRVGASLCGTPDDTKLTLTMPSTRMPLLSHLTPIAVSQAAFQQAVVRHTLDSNLQWHDTRVQPGSQHTRVTLTLHDFYLAELLSLATALATQPVIIEHLTLTVHEWQLHAVIKLVVWGS